MRAVSLIGWNFVRENRWPILVLVFWALASGAGAALSAPESVDDSLFFLKQQTVYGIALTAFLSSSAIHNQRRSRRILGVLSKSIDRWQYLLGILYGVALTSGVYCVLTGVTGAWTLTRLHGNVSFALPIALMLFSASLLSGVVALFYSTFLNPLFALLLTGLTLGTTAALSHVSQTTDGLALPAYSLLQSIMTFSLDPAWHPQWPAIFWALMEAILFWLAGSWIFSQRDIAVAVE